MEITMLEMIIDEKRTILEKKLKGSNLIEEFEIEDLDKVDRRKTVLLVFKNPVDAHYLNQLLISIFGATQKKQLIEED